MKDLIVKAELDTVNHFATTGEIPLASLDEVHLHMDGHDVS